MSEYFNFISRLIKYYYSCGGKKKKKESEEPVSRIYRYYPEECWWKGRKIPFFSPAGEKEDKNSNYFS